MANMSKSQMQEDIEMALYNGNINESEYCEFLDSIEFGIEEIDEPDPDPAQYREALIAQFKARDDAYYDKPTLTFHRLNGRKMPPFTRFIRHALRACREVGPRCLRWRSFWLPLLGYMPVKPIALLLLCIVLIPTEYALGWNGSDNRSGEAAYPRHKRDEQKTPKIAWSDDSFDLHFHYCEENEKHHWSCKFVDAKGDEHWMYIPNFNPKNVDNSPPQN